MKKNVLIMLLACLFVLPLWGQGSGYLNMAKRTYNKVPLEGVKSGGFEYLIYKDKVLMEGDIYVGDTTFLNKFQFMQFSVTVDQNASKWGNGIVPYMFNSGFATAEKNAIIDAMNHIMDKTNVRFIEKTDQSSFIIYRKVTVAELGFSGGMSALGRQNSNGQFIDFSASNFSASLAIHEICHALGLYHEQAREDRDNHINILTQNIQAGMGGQFAKRLRNAVDVGNYDFASIMHYRYNDFGIDGRRTIERKSNPSDMSFGFSSTSRLSAGDIAGINSLYPTEQGNYTIPYTGTGVIKDELGIGETKTFTVRAGETYNFPKIYLRKDKKYVFTVTGGTWKNGGKASTGAAGYAKEMFDMPRQGNYNMMALVGELYDKNGDGMSFNGTHFLIGTSRTWTASKSGYLGCFANDNLLMYGDNTGTVTVSIRRTE